MTVATRAAATMLSNFSTVRTDVSRALSLLSWTSRARPGKSFSSTST